MHAPQLTRLDIHANDLLRLPSWVCRCAQLCRLVVTGARLANLPDSISRLTGLDHLTVELSQVGGAPALLNPGPLHRFTLGSPHAGWRSPPCRCRQCLRG